MRNPVTVEQLDFTKDNIGQMCGNYRVKGRYDSAAFLVWYLEHYYRLEPFEAVSSVCDEPGDKGIDGILVNDNEQTILVFQSRIFDDHNTQVGDKPLRTLAGTLMQFASPEATYVMIESAGDAKVSALAKYLEIATKVAEGYEVRGVFLCNAFLDQNGADFIKEAPIDFVGAIHLRERYIPSTRTKPIHDPIVFDVSPHEPTQYSSGQARTIIVPVKATALVKMSGISNQSLFHYNVRAPLGKTAVNRSIAKTIKDKTQHSSFPLFHNGITVIAKSVKLKGKQVSIEDYFVVNGCQSLTALHEHSQHLTDDLQVLLKFIEMEPESELAASVTRISNNQNGVSARDFKANNRIQIRLQNEMAKHYDGSFAFEIKRGETLNANEIIPNQDAGLLLTAFDLKEPWATHRRYLIFEERHGVVFGRVSADRIVMLWVMSEVIRRFLPKITNELFAQYLITIYFLVYVLRLMLEKDDLGKELITSPEKFVRTPELRKKFDKCLETIMSDLVVDLDAEINLLAADFDYRDKLRDKDWVTKLASTLVKEREKQIAKKRTETFKDEWTKLDASGATA